MTGLGFSPVTRQRATRSTVHGRALAGRAAQRGHELVRRVASYAVAGVGKACEGYWATESGGKLDGVLDRANGVVVAGQHEGGTPHGA